MKAQVLPFRIAQAHHYPAWRADIDARVASWRRKKRIRAGLAWAVLVGVLGLMVAEAWR